LILARFIHSSQPPRWPGGSRAADGCVRATGRPPARCCVYACGLCVPSDRGRAVRILRAFAAPSPSRGMLRRSVLNAATHGELALVTEWLDGNAADANIVNARCTECAGMTLLIGSAIGGQKAVIALLLRRQADIDMQDAEGHSALMAATEHAQTAAVAALLKSGASTDLRDAVDGETALMAACSSGHSAIVLMLLQAGAEADATDTHGATALEHAARRGHAAVLKLLCKRLSSGPDGAAIAVRALILSAMQGHTKAVEVMLSSTGLRADACDSKGVSALQVARIEGHAACVELLEASLDADADALRQRGAPSSGHSRH
jgi:ankyrin repeat protein